MWDQVDHVGSGGGRCNGNPFSFSATAEDVLIRHAIAKEQIILLMTSAASNRPVRAIVELKWWIRSFPFNIPAYGDLISPRGNERRLILFTDCPTCKSKLLRLIRTANSN
jgi:hypothetical protein